MGIVLALGAIAVIAMMNWIALPAILGIATKAAWLKTTPLMFGTTLTPEQLAEFKTLLEGMKVGWEDIKGLPAKVKALQDAAAKQLELETSATKMREELDQLRRQFAQRRSTPTSVRLPGRVSIECAEFIGAAYVLGNAKAGRLDMLPEHIRGTLFSKSKGILGLETKAALTTTDIPLPTEYFSEVRELISDFGVARNKMMGFPIGMGTAKPPRFKTRPSFGSIAMSAALAEKSPQIDFASLESHKIGGIVRTPREIDEQSIVPMGQFLAKYGAVEFARAEDTWAFLADGTSTYENVTGVCKTARTANNKIVMASGLTHPSDATLTHFRNLRTKVNKAALSGKRSAYYLDTTWETTLRSFNTESDLYSYIRLPDGSATLDGYPIIWTDVLQPYTTSVAADAYLAVFGAMDFWWFGEKGSPRMDFSQDVYFATDELATRFIEEIDFDYQQLDVTAVLITAAS